MDKRVFLSLLFLNKDVLTLDDLLHIETLGDAPVEITMDHAATVLTDNGYVDTDTGALTPDGQEALHVGQHLYGEDGDVQSVIDQLRVQEVVDHGETPQSLYDRISPDQ
ncbi:hypothetical protein QA600_12480 [Natronococcus sp. A-GB1]|uniref:hypothetical protein n=1 Tax=Natronococcus sp. A-GB1 TaxID=3037648 RepID=UPI00241DB271|nr:hypothetical protein [Natronococcus sp. A-GB1]MDG5760155.1 hypothetical protein [Natronococcus sp. A-GB1]